MGTQEIAVVAIALAAGGWLLRGWIKNAKKDAKCGGCGCGCRKPKEKK